MPIPADSDLDARMAMLKQQARDIQANKRQEG
jgi:hypothetical protein